MEKRLNRWRKTDRPPAAEPTHERRFRATVHPDLVVAGLVFVIACAFYYRAPVTQMYDSFRLTAVSHSLLTEGDLSIPPSLYQRGSYTERVHNGRIYHFYPNAPAVLNVPFVAAFEALGISVWGPDGEWVNENEVRILRASAAVATALTAALFYVLARIYLGVRCSLGLAAVFAFGSQLFSTASRAYWSHSWGVLLLTLALCLILSPALRSRTASYVVAATALSWAYFCRPSFALSVVGLTLFLLGRERRRFLPWFVATGGLWLVLFSLHARAVYGLALPPYFLRSRVVDSLTLEGLLKGCAGGTWGTLISPGRGLFVYTPILAVILVAAVWHWRHLPSRALAALALGVIIAQWKLSAALCTWSDGGWFGARFFTDVVPWFFVLGVLALAATYSAAAKRRRKPGAAQIGLWVLAAVLSIFINTRGATSQETFVWGDLPWAPGHVRRALYNEERLWNWRYPQFLAGLVPEPPPERFLSWTCSGAEMLVPRCRQRRLQVAIRGAPGAAYSLRLSTDEYRPGVLGATGRAVEKFRKIPGGESYATVLWDCGTVLTKHFACAE